MLFKQWNTKKLLNPTYLYCPKELAKKYGEALTICNALQGGSGNKFWFEEVKAAGTISSCLTTKQVREEIYYEFDRAYAYVADKNNAEDFDEYNRKALNEANKLIGDELNKKIDDFILKQEQAFTR